MALLWVVPTPQTIMAVGSNKELPPEQLAKVFNDADSHFKFQNSATTVGQIDEDHSLNNLIGTPNCINY